MNGPLDFAIAIKRFGFHSTHIPFLASIAKIKLQEPRLEHPHGGGHNQKALEKARWGIWVTANSVTKIHSELFAL